MEPISRLPSPWGPDSSPLPSPGPPPSPAHWMLPEWTAGARNDSAHARSLPLIPSGYGTYPAQPPNTTFSPLPEHPDFLRCLRSHPLITQTSEYSNRTPSPSSSLSSMEVVQHPQPDNKPVPFPMSSGVSTPERSLTPASGITTPDYTLYSRSGFTTPATFKSAANTNQSSRNQTPDPAPAPRVPPPPAFVSPPPPPPLIPHPVRNSRSIQLKMPVPPSKKSVPARPRLPALRRSLENMAAIGPRTESTSPSYVKKSNFYMQDGMVVLKVEGTLYKVHKFLLEQHSDFFKGLILDEADAMGHSEDRPIPLPESVTQQAFESLLGFLYTGVYDPASVSLADWVHILRISTLLRFPKIRDYAIRELSARRASLAPVEAILLAKDHNIPQWLGPAYAELVRRPMPLDDTEAERLGVRLTVQLSRAREMLRAEEYALYQQRRYGSRYSPPERPEEQLVARAVNEVFQLAGAQ